MRSHERNRSIYMVVGVTLQGYIEHCSEWVIRKYGLPSYIMHVVCSQYIFFFLSIRNDDDGLKGDLGCVYLHDYKYGKYL